MIVHPGAEPRRNQRPGLRLIEFCKRAVVLLLRLRFEPVQPAGVNLLANLGRVSDQEVEELRNSRLNCARLAAARRYQDIRQPRKSLHLERREKSDLGDGDVLGNFDLRQRCARVQTKRPRNGSRRRRSRSALLLGQQKPGGNSDCQGSTNEITTQHRRSSGTHLTLNRPASSRPPLGPPANALAIVSLKWA